MRPAELFYFIQLSNVRMRQDFIKKDKVPTIT